MCQGLGLDWEDAMERWQRGAAVCQCSEPGALAEQRAGV